MGRDERQGALPDRRLGSLDHPLTGADRVGRPRRAWPPRSRSRGADRPRTELDQLLVDGERRRFDLLEQAAQSLGGVGERRRAVGERALEQLDAVGAELVEEPQRRGAREILLSRPSA